MRTIMALCRKDIALLRGPMALGVVLLVLPYPLVIYGQVYGDLTTNEAFIAASRFSMFLSLVVVAAVGGNAVAAERLDNSDLFLTYLPPSRRQILASKGLVSVIYLVAIWATNLTIFYLAAQRPSRIGGAEDALVPGLAASGILVFGCAWCASCVSRNSSTGTLLGIIVAPAVWATVNFVVPLVDGHPRAVPQYYQAAAAALGLLGIVFGWLLYLSPMISEKLASR